jgi:hypothetical protein
MDERTHRRYRLIRAAAGGGNAVDIFRNLLAGGNKAGQGVGQQNGEECDREGQYAMSQNSARDKTERPPPRGRSRLARHLLQRLAVPHRIPVFGRGSASTFDGFGNLTKGLTFSPERAACVAECRVSEHAGLIHAFDAGDDPGPQQQSTLFDQVGHFREVQLGIAEGLRGAVLGGLGHDRILRVHLLHGLFQGRHVIDHRKTAPATVASMAQLVRVVPWRSELLRSKLSDDRRSCRNRDRGRQSRRWQRSSLGTARASCTYSDRAIISGNSKQ